MVKRMQTKELEIGLVEESELEKGVREDG